MPILYKYIDLNPLGDAEGNRTKLDTILEGKLYFAKPQQFNDPFDTVLRFKSKDDESLMNDLKTLAEKACRDHSPMAHLGAIEMNKAIDRMVFANGAGGGIRPMPIWQIMDKCSFFLPEEVKRLKEKYFPQGSSAAICYQIVKEVGVCSVSEDKTNHLLWGHYADGHKGLCIGLEIVGGYSELHKVIYSSEIPLAIEYEENISDSRQRYFIDQLFTAICTKYLDWSYEKEHRLLIRTTGESTAVRFKIVEIIFGLKTTRCFDRGVRSKLERLSSEVKSSHVDGINKEFQLTIEEGRLNHWIGLIYHSPT